MQAPAGALGRTEEKYSSEIEPVEIEGPVSDYEVRDKLPYAVGGFERYFVHYRRLGGMSVRGS